MAKVRIVGFATVVVVGNFGGPSNMLSGGSITSSNCQGNLTPDATGLGISLGGFWVSFPCNASEGDCEFENGDTITVTHAGFLLTRTTVRWNLKGCSDSYSFWNFGTIGYITGNWRVKK